MHELINFLCGWNRIPQETLDEFHEFITAKSRLTTQTPIKINGLGGRIYLAMFPIFLCLSGVIILKGEMKHGLVDVGIIATILAIYICLPIMLRQTLFLDDRGFQLTSHWGTLTVPWSCIDTSRQSHVNPPQLLLPIRGIKLSEVAFEKMSGKKYIGQEIRTSLIELVVPNQLKIFWCVKFPPSLIIELARLAVEVNPQLFYPANTNAVLPDSQLSNNFESGGDSKLPDGVHIDKRGRIFLGFTSYYFPANCCVCGVSTDHEVTIVVRHMHRFVLPSSGTQKIPVICCEKCQSYFHWKKIVINGICIALFTFLIAGMLHRWDWTKNLNMTFVFISLLIALVIQDRIVRWLIFRWWKIAFAAYDPGSSTVRFQFRYPDYARMMIENMRKSQNKILDSEYDHELDQA